MGGAKQVTPQNTFNLANEKDDEDIVNVSIEDEVEEKWLYYNRKHNFTNSSKVKFLSSDSLGGGGNSIFSRPVQVLVASCSIHQSPN